MSVKKFSLLGLFMLAAQINAQAQNRQDFVLINKTGYEISEVYISTIKTNDWEENVIGDESLEDDEARTIRFANAGKACIWDLKVVYEDDDSTAVWNGIDLCKTSRVTLFYNRNSGRTSATFD
jgi:hypothetical protein